MARTKTAIKAEISDVIVPEMVVAPETAIQSNRNGASLPPYKQFLRGIAEYPIKSHDGQFFTIEQVDAELESYYKQGYRLFSVTPEMVHTPTSGGTSPTTLHWRVFYVLVLQEPMRITA